MHARTGLHTCMSGCACTFIPRCMCKTLNMVLHKQKYFLSAHRHRPHYCCPTMSLHHLEAEKHHRKWMFLELFLFFPSPSPLSLFQYLLMPEPISVSLCLRGCRQPKSMDVWLKISLQGIMRQRCCYDYYALLPVPAHEIMLELWSTTLDPSHCNEINHTRPLEIRTNILTFTLFGGVWFW